jgi:hypothetical protein
VTDTTELGAAETETSSRGRPSKYRAEFAEKAKRLCELGATDADLALIFDVTTVTIWRWQAEYEEFCNALKVGKAACDDRVERSLYQRAVGYSYNSQKIFQDKGSPVIVPYVEHVPPDPGAAKLWLTNRRRGTWADTSKHEVTGRDGAALLPEDQPTDRAVARAILAILSQAKLEGSASTTDQPDEPSEEANLAELAEQPNTTNRVPEAVPQASAPKADRLNPGEREVFDSGAFIIFESEFGKHGVYGPDGRLHGYRRAIADARALASNIKPLPPPTEKDPYGRR